MELAFKIKHKCKSKYPSEETTMSRGGGIFCYGCGKMIRVNRDEDKKYLGKDIKYFK
ncbi:MAG: hypothetical protein AABY22_06915 [Nanoarchaeota archaeon]